MGFPPKRVASLNLLSSCFNGLIETISCYFFVVLFHFLPSFLFSLRIFSFLFFLFSWLFILGGCFEVVGSLSDIGASPLRHSFSILWTMLRSFKILYRSENPAHKLDEILEVRN